ncbi:MAG: DUF1631 family protein [Proteobacteria bacterium]|nr:DUF1631 family protein [Pseudomonadota bacterium]
MKPSPVHRLPAPLEAAVQTIKLVARGAVERTIESLGLAALAATNVFQRDGLLGAQFELNRKSAVFVLSFNDAFDERVTREVAPRTGAPGAAKPPAWDALSLVEDHEVEVQISAERFGLETAHKCEWELRELDAYVGAILGTPGGEHERNPLRPEVVGDALIRAVEAVSERADTRKVLLAEMSRSLADALPLAYGEIVAGLRNAGVQPLSLALRQRASRGDASGVATDFDTLGRPLERGAASSRAGLASGLDSHYGSRQGAASGGGSAASTRSGAASRWRGSRGGTPIGSVDPALMSLMRRLVYLEGAAGGADAFADDGGAGDAALSNVIHAHRDELRRASHGALDHMVIDVIGTLFEQILADPRVPPQLARQIARLQVPVLRAALGDPAFFASRRHPVRRFVNRIASLGAAFDDIGDESARAFVAKVRALVQEVVEGDFDHVEIYESKLAALEAFAAELAHKEIAADAGARTAELLAHKEDEQRLRALYAQRLEGDLKSVSAPEFVREFIARVWSQVLLEAARRGGADGALARRMRHAGRELFLSVQPKPTPAHRKAFLAELPQLMQQLTEGMNLIGWPESERRAFFGRLMPAHAEALKAAAVRQLDLNLMARQVEGALDKELPSRGDLGIATGVLPVLTDEIALPRFSAEEAAQVGLLDESAVDWKAPVALDPVRRAEEAEIEQAAAALLPPPAADPLAGDDFDSMPMSAPLAVGDLAAPTQGRDLAAEVQVGFAYQMHLEGAWQKVRLSHVSPGHTFFVFTHGQRHKHTVSLTHRMLVRLCEDGRFRSYESAQLLERATARARRQLAALGQPRS